MKTYYKLKIFAIKYLIFWIVILINICNFVYAETNKTYNSDLEILKSIGFTFPPISTECTQKNMDIPQNVREFVMHKTGYHNVEYVGKWKGYRVYKGVFCDNVTHYRGYPQYALYKNNKVRRANHVKEENIEIYKYFLSKKH